MSSPSESAQPVSKMRLIRNDRFLLCHREEGPEGYLFTSPMSARTHEEKKVMQAKMLRNYMDKGVAHLHTLRLATTTPRRRFRSAEEVC